MLKKLSLILMLAISFTAGANAATIDFDDVKVNNPAGGYNAVQAISNYAGFQWSNFEIVLASDFTSNPRGDNDDVSHPNFVDNTDGSIASIYNPTTLFNFDQAYFAAWQPSSFNLLISGYKNGGLVHSQTINLSGTYNNPALYTFSQFNNIDTLVFGTPTSAGQWFAMDNFQYSPAPEPASAVMGLLSLAGVLGFKKRK